MTLTLTKEPEFGVFGRAEVNQSWEEEELNAWLEDFMCDNQ
jgi:hypothetical protein